MTEEEHIARAMLMGMYYHHGNGEPFYYSHDGNGQVDVVSMLDANTLEPLIGNSDIDEQVSFRLPTDRVFSATKHAIHQTLVEREKRQGLDTSRPILNDISYNLTKSVWLK